MVTVKRSFWKSRKLQVDILTEFFILLLATSFSIIWYSYDSNSKSIIKFSDDLIAQISKTSIDKTVVYLEQARTISNLTKMLVEKPEDISIKNTKIISFMLGALQEYNYIESLYISNEEGSFLQIRRLPEKSTYRTYNKLLPGGCEYAVRFVDRSGPEATENWYYNDKKGRTLDIETLPKATYDHRSRSWYLGVRQSVQLYWSEIYIFNTSQLPGLTVVYPLVDPNGKFYGATATDITMDTMSRFMQESKIGKLGIAFLVSDKGELIAHNDISQVVKAVGDQINTVIIDEVEDKRIAFAYQIHRNENKARFIFDKDGVSYIATFTDFPKNFGKKWKIGIVVPLEEFVGDVNRTQRETFLISLIFLIISAVVIIILSRRLSKPIVKLAQEAENLKNFKLDGKIDVISNTYEIQLLNDAMHSMHKTLQAFSKFVPRDLVGKLIKKGVDVKIGGRSRLITIFFSDIEGFTTVMERYPADKMMHHLSEYFDELTKIIMDLNGTIDKYIGDSIMAFWGAPLADRTHALNACRAALTCQKRVTELNRKWHAEGKPQLVTRIGIHTGEVIVGNMGSSDRMNYTIIGDGVNLAARLEGENKHYSTKIIISEDVYERVNKVCLARPLDIVRVKGKNQAIKIYELVAFKTAILKSDASLLPSQTQQKYCELFEKAFNLYREQYWDEAIKILQEILTKYGEDKILNLYIQRCNYNKMNPLDKDWDGVSKTNNETIQSDKV